MSCKCRPFIVLCKNSPSIGNFKPPSSFESSPYLMNSLMALFLLLSKVLPLMSNKSDTMNEIKIQIKHISTNFYLIVKCKRQGRNLFTMPHYILVMRTTAHHSSRSCTQFVKIIFPLSRNIVARYSSIIKLASSVFFQDFPMKYRTV